MSPFAAAGLGGLAPAIAECADSIQGVSIVRAVE